MDRKPRSERKKGCENAGQSEEKTGENSRRHAVSGQSLQFQMKTGEEVVLQFAHREGGGMGKEMCPGHCQKASGKKKNFVPELERERKPGGEAKGRTECQLTCQGGGMAER